MYLNAFIVYLNAFECIYSITENIYGSGFANRS
jgi:hypothetical protein